MANPAARWRLNTEDMTDPFQDGAGTDSFYHLDSSITKI